MRRKASRILMAVIVVMLLLSPIAAESSKAQPTITALRSQFNVFPLKVYSYNAGCENHKMLEALFHEAIRDLRKSIMRFADEHPEYSRLLQLTFSNASSLREADIIFVSTELDEYFGLTNYTSGKAYVHVRCDILRHGTRGWAHGVILHELMHALGVDHAWQQFTDYKEPELMLYVPAETKEKVWPSTLDLHALYISLFGEFGPNEPYKNVTLPRGMPYRMVIPYDVEIQRLREEIKNLERDNENLWRHIKQLRGLIEELEEANRGLGAAAGNLSRENMELKMINEALQEQLINTWAELQLTSQILDHYRMENERLRQNLTEIARMGLFLADYCNKTILELIEKNKGLRANLSATIEYAREVENTLTFLRTSVIILGIAALILILLHYRSLRRAEAEEEEIEEEPLNQA